jgi:hypothetical protein
MSCIQCNNVRSHLYDKYGNTNTADVLCDMCEEPVDDDWDIYKSNSGGGEAFTPLHVHKFDSNNACACGAKLEKRSYFTEP